MIRLSLPPGRKESPTAREYPGAPASPVIHQFYARLIESEPEGSKARAMSRPTDDVKNWMNMFRWIVKLIRDEYEVDESILTRSAVLESDCGLVIEQVEALLGIIAESFQLRFPPGTLDEVVKLEELCMVASWMKGLYKRPEFISDGFEAACRASNATCG
jgi:hypothetical protein